MFTLIGQLIPTAGIGSAFALLMAYFYNKSEIRNREELKAMGERHKEEMIEVSQDYRDKLTQIVTRQNQREDALVGAMNHNTEALVRLCERIGPANQRH